MAGPSVTDLEVSYTARAAAEAWYENAGSWVARFERQFAEHLGRRHAIALPSCTAGLHLALLAAGVGPGDEVIVPDATWIASAAPVTYVGATTVFADIDPATWCIDPKSVEALITERTRAVIAVDLYGSMPPLDALEALCRDHGVTLIEDAAEALGSSWNGKAAGAFGLTAAFSFHGSKTLTTGEGGMVVTDDSAVFDRMSILRDHGRHPGDLTFSNFEIGYKYKMSDLQAAFGTAQLERFAELLSIRHRQLAWYRERLAGLEGVTMNPEVPGLSSSAWMVTVVFDPELGVTKESARDRLDAEGIGTRPFFHPLSSLAAYAADTQAAEAAMRNRVAYRICPFGLNLPSAARLEEQDVELVCTAVRKLVEQR